MKRVMKVLKNNKGASMVLTLCMTLLLFAIGTSVLVAASDAAGTNIRRESSQIRFYFAKSLGSYLTKQLTAPLDIDPDNPWTMIPQQAYSVNPTGNGADRLKVTDFKIEIDDPAMDSWIESPQSVEYIVSLDSQTVTLKQAFEPATPGIGAVGDIDYMPSEAAVPEETQVELKMTVDINTIYSGNTYVLKAHYKFTGTTLGDTNAAGTGKINSGTWSLLGYSQE